MWCPLRSVWLLVCLGRTFFFFTNEDLSFLINISSKCNFKFNYAKADIPFYIKSCCSHFLFYFFMKIISNSISIFYPAVQTTDIITDIAVKLWFQQSGCSSSSQEVTCPNAEGVWWVCVCELSVCEYECVYSQETLRAGRWIPNEVRAPHWRLLGWTDRWMDGWMDEWNMKPWEPVGVHVVL